MYAVTQSGANFQVSIISGLSPRTRSGVGILASLVLEVLGVYQSGDDLVSRRVNASSEPTGAEQRLPTCLAASALTDRLCVGGCIRQMRLATASTPGKLSEEELAHEQCAQEIMGRTRQAIR